MTNLLTDAEIAEISEYAQEALHNWAAKYLVGMLVHVADRDIPRLLAHIEAQAKEIEKVRRALDLCAQQQARK